jgi:hypothetical protein
MVRIAMKSPAMLGASFSGSRPFASGTRPENLLHCSCQDAARLYKCSRMPEAQPQLKQ